jgi:class 3 adenylate cyclase/predicted ATPase
MRRMADWLETLDLGQYAQLFAENAIDFDVLPDLTDQDLEKLGVLLGHRRRLLRAIGSLADTPKPSGSSAAPDVGERRHLTLLFCDLVGSTALSAHLDPEDLRQLYRAYRDACVRVVARYDGLLAQFMGDGVMVYFGYPQAHEDDAERAVRAGLDIISTVGWLRTPAGGRVEARVGIATGLVVVGDLSSQAQAVVGETPNLAARLQAAATPGKVVVAASTRRLLGQLFRLRPLGGLRVKGVAEPVEAWIVEGETLSDSRFEMVRARRLTSFVGREREVALLDERHRLAWQGKGQILLISGEAGIGKSRFAAQFAERIADQPHTRLRYQCSPYHAASAFHPIIEQLKRAACLDPGDLPDQQLDKVEAMIGRATPQVSDVAPLFAALLSLPSGDRYPPLGLTGAQRRQQTLTALVNQLESVARKNPVLLLFEDVHWADASTLEALDLLAERVPELPLLALITSRPEFQPHWMGQPQVSLLVLNRLDPCERTALVEQIAGGKALPDEIVAQIVDRTDGVPLFVEELTKSVLESGLLRDAGDRYVLDGALPPFAIPTTLHDSLMARLDRLASVRLVAQIGAAIGREFPYALLHAVSRLAEDELQTALARLVASELIFQRGSPPDAVYSFKHALVQDAAHASLLHSSSQQLHAQIAEALAIHSPELVDSQPELFAHHYAQAGLVEKSVAAWGKAGQQSAARSALAEAATQFQKALEQLALLTDSPERFRQELEFRSGLGAALQAVKGQAAPKTGEVYARARVLWEQLGSPSEFLQVPYGQSRYHLHRGELDLAIRLDEDLLCASQLSNDSGGRVLAHQSCGAGQLLAGRFTLSRSHLEESLALYDPISHRSLARQAGFHPHVNSLAVLGIVLFCLGYPDQALERSSAAIAEARKLAHPPSSALSLTQRARLLSLAGDDAALDELADQLAAVATEQGFPVWRALGVIYRGWVKAQKGDVAEGISVLRSGLAAYRATGAELLMPHHFALLARACEIAGQFEEALTLLDDALEIVGRTGERWLVAELNRHEGQLLLRQGRAEAAEERSAKLWTSPWSRGPSSGNCAPPQASPGSAVTRAATPKPAICSNRSTAGSPRASTLPI